MTAVARVNFISTLTWFPRSCSLSCVLSALSLSTFLCNPRSHTFQVDHLLFQEHSHRESLLVPPCRLDQQFIIVLPLLPPTLTVQVAHGGCEAFYWSEEKISPARCRVNCLQRSPWRCWTLRKVYADPAPNTGHLWISLCEKKII